MTMTTTTMRLRAPLFSVCLLAFGAQAVDLSIGETALGRVYTDRTGMTLYTFARDTPGRSMCEGACLQAWPPLRVGDATPPFPGLEVMRRADGTSQWTLYNRPLYRWHKDLKPGDIRGAGMKNLWSLARADDVPVHLATAPEGQRLTTLNGMTLYTFARDEKGRSACDGECAVNWPPLVASNGRVTSGPFSIVVRSDGTRQWAYQGAPLYTWVKDRRPGDMPGDKVRDVWHVARP